MTTNFIKENGDFDTTEYITQLKTENENLKQQIEFYKSQKQNKNNYYKNKYANDPIYREKKLQENRRQYLIRKQKKNISLNNGK
jgi:hypothetical protein|tara:strand:- start:687 stop:938 length:252 start_codon:yes stop_codon:yes gene_type:complete